MWSSTGTWSLTARSLTAGDRRHARPRELDQIRGGELQLEPTTTCADVDRLVVERRRVHDGRQCPPLTEWADAARDVAGRPLRAALALRHSRPLAESAQVELRLDGHDGDGQRAVDVRDERLEHACGIQAELLDRLEPVGLGTRVVPVLVHAEGDAGTGQQPRSPVCPSLPRGRG